MKIALPHWFSSTTALKLGHSCNPFMHHPLIITFNIRKVRCLCLICLTDSVQTEEGFYFFKHKICRNIINNCLCDFVREMQVTARLMDRQFAKFGPSMSSISQLNSSVYNPTYNFHAEIRESNLPPTATFLFKVCRVVD